MSKSWETIGLEENWIENGWTEEQMNARIRELNLPPPRDCAMMPYYLNYMQRPDMNQLTLKIRQEMQSLGVDDASWIAASNLWTPGQTINIVFSSNVSSRLQEFIKTALAKYLQPHVSMKLAYPGGTSGDVLVDVLDLKGQGGNSLIGKIGSNQLVNLSKTEVDDAKLDVSKLTGAVGSAENDRATFYYPRYLICHEFGHVMGLWHEWNREMCGQYGFGRSTSCSGSEDAYSVMNYAPKKIESTGKLDGATDAQPSSHCLDAYSPNDIRWLEYVYKDGKNIGTIITPSPRVRVPIQTGTGKIIGPAPMFYNLENDINTESSSNLTDEMYIVYTIAILFILVVIVVTNHNK